MSTTDLAITPLLHINEYRSHYCASLRKHHVGTIVRLAGWVDRKRDHGNLLFVDLRDCQGLIQLVLDIDNKYFDTLVNISLESVLTVTGRVVARNVNNINQQLLAGEVEIHPIKVHILSQAHPLPVLIKSDSQYSENMRLQFRYLDLRRHEMQRKINLRSDIIASLRRRMAKQGFREYQTPILTASSPEGARDFLVPSRLHPGHFYALPQAPQQFKQLLMMAGFDRYFQIAPCFRDEDARADRSPGEFYQLDVEMSFVTQEDIFTTLEPVIGGVFKEFADSKSVSSWPFVRITYHDSILKYGTDKPDLRNPIVIVDVSRIFMKSNFKIFAENVARGQVVRAIPAPGVGNYSRKFFDILNKWVRKEGYPGLGYISFKSEHEIVGSIAKNINKEQMLQIFTTANLKIGDAIFFVCGEINEAAKLAGKIRTLLGTKLALIDKSKFAFCWIVDFPMFERDIVNGGINFSHNPFSMPQGGMTALNNQYPLDILAWQHDIVCNGIELASGAIRNHLPEIMYRVFSIAGYTKLEVDTKFGSIIEALKFGAPPHGGSAPGIDRIVMLLAGVDNIREITAFPLNQQGQDLMMKAPNSVDSKQIKELGLILDAN